MERELTAIVEELEQQLRDFSLTAKAREHARALRQLWAFPSRPLTEIDRAYLESKEDRLKAYLDFAGQLGKFRREVTENYLVRLPWLGQLLEDVARLADALPGDPTASQRLSGAARRFLENRWAARKVNGGSQTSRLDPALVFDATTSSDEAFIVSDGYLRHYLLNYDTITNRIDPATGQREGRRRYAETVKRVLSAHPVDALIFPTKIYGPAGPIREKERYADEYPRTRILVHDSTAGRGEGFRSSQALLDGVHDVAILYDLVFTGNGVLSVMDEFTRAAHRAPKSAQVVVLSSEADDALQKKLDAANVSIHEVFPYRDHRRDYGRVEYPNSWEAPPPLRRPLRFEETPFYAPVRVFDMLLAGLSRPGSRGR